MTTLILALLASLAQAEGPPVVAVEPAWKLYADCSAAHYADARLPDPKRTLVLKQAAIGLGRRYSVEALRLHLTEVKDGKARASAYTKSYIMERARLLALRPRINVLGLLRTCPKPPE